ncbi:MAG: hypothetical protein WCJ30_00505 [Deltaproteobacteria bacterium]
MSLSSRGLRDMDAGPEAIADEAERAAVRRQAMRVHAKALTAALVFTALVVALART